MFFPESRSESKSDEDVEEEFQAFVHDFFQNVILPSSAAEDPSQFMLTAAAESLTRALTDDEGKELSMSEAGHFRQLRSPRPRGELASRPSRRLAALQG